MAHGAYFTARRLTARKKSSMFINTACQLFVNACDKSRLTVCFFFFLRFYAEPWVGSKKSLGLILLLRKLLRTPNSRTSHCQKKNLLAAEVDSSPRLNSPKTDLLYFFFPLWHSRNLVSLYWPWLSGSYVLCPKITTALAIEDSDIRFVRMFLFSPRDQRCLCNISWVYTTLTSSYLLSGYSNRKSFPCDFVNMSRAAVWSS